MNFDFNAARFEKDFVGDSLLAFYEDQWITDVLFRVAAGKEATVYCCRGHESAEIDLVAAKVYRPRKARAMRNYSMYQEGRDTLGMGGKGQRDRRLARAMQKRSKLGRKVETESWLQHEYQAMRQLYDIGADIPCPLEQYGNAILMEFIGGEQGGAPLLKEVGLERDEAERLYKNILDNIELFLACDRIHGDLSAFNVLYWEGEAVIIDFPQMVDPRSNRHAFDLLARDVEKVSDYFRRQGVETMPGSFTADLWSRYMHGQLNV